MDSDKELLRHIKNRTRAENKMISLENILKAYHMEMYFQSCADRIASEELIDGEHIQIDFINFPNLLFDSEGIEECFEILSGYVDRKELIKIWKYARSNDKITEYTNNQFDIMRNTNIKTLLEFSFNMRKFRKQLEKLGKSADFPEDYLRQISEQSRAELFSRMPFNKVRIWIREKIMSLYVSIRYWNIFSILRKCAKDTVQ